MTQPSPDPGTADTGIEPTHLSTSRISRWQMVGGALGLVVVLWVGNETYNVISATGGGPGGIHDPGQLTPDEPREEIDPGDDDVHDPSQFDHG